MEVRVEANSPQGKAVVTVLEWNLPSTVCVCVCVCMCVCVCVRIRKGFQASAQRALIATCDTGFRV